MLLKIKNCSPKLLSTLTFRNVLYLLGPFGSGSGVIHNSTLEPRWFGGGQRTSTAATVVYAALYSRRLGGLARRCSEEKTRHDESGKLRWGEDSNPRPLQLWRLVMSMAQGRGQHAAINLPEPAIDESYL